MNQAKKVKINIGAGQTYIPGFINIDISDKADLSLDLGTDRLPFEDSSVDLIFSYHTLEHVPDYLFALSEIHRVLKHGGRFLVGLPYVTLTEYHLVNPYHLHNFNEYSFDFFNPDVLKGSAAEENPILFTKIFHQFYYIGFFKIIPPPFRGWCRRHLFNVVRKIDFGLIVLKETVPETPVCSKKELIREFQKCLNSRIPYETSEKSRNPKLIHHLAKSFLNKMKRFHGWWLGL